MSADKKPRRAQRPRMFPDDDINKSNGTPIEKKHPRRNDGPRDRDPKQQTEQRPNPPRQKEDEKHPSRPTIQVRKDISAAPTWAKGTSGPSFADMVRHNPDVRRFEGKPTLSTAKGERSVEKKDIAPKPAKAPSPAQEQQQQQRTSQQPTPTVKEQDASAVKTEEITVALPPPPSATAYYVLEVERVERLKLPASVVETANMSSAVYTFSSVPGKPPTPPASPPQQTMYRDVPHLSNNRPWGSLGDAGRIQQAPWPATTPAQPMEYLYNTPTDRSNTAQRFHMQYNSYPAPAAQQPMRTGPANPNFYPQRLVRGVTVEVSDAGLRQPLTAPFTRPSNSSGGVW